MTIEQLRHFIAVAQAGSISRAANLLYISHSAVSKSISSLERESGMSAVGSHE